MALTPHFTDHCADCPPVDPFSTEPLSCATCAAIRRDPYRDAGAKCVTCSRCGRTDVPTSSDPRFAGYAALHSEPGDWRSTCPGSHHAHGRAVAERDTAPGWFPLAHARAGDTIRERLMYVAPGRERPNRDLLYVRPDGDRLSVAWLHSHGTDGFWAAPGTPVLLVRPISGLPPISHVRVYFSNAISSRYATYQRCYPTRAEADADIQAFRPYNNTRSDVHECWRTGCFK
jgi:hypothetical protein